LNHWFSTTRNGKTRDNHVMEQWWSKINHDGKLL